MLYKKNLILGWFESMINGRFGYDIELVLRVLTSVEYHENYVGLINRVCA